MASSRSECVEGRQAGLHVDEDTRAGFAHARWGRQHDPHARAAVAGTFYPAAARELGRRVRSLLRAGRPSADPAPKALIAPHAGYVYSGPVAATAYARIAAAARARSAASCCSVPVTSSRCAGSRRPRREAFATPLGAVEIDREALEPVLALPQVVVRPRRTPASTASRSSCRSCRFCSAISASCRWWWATRPRRGGGVLELLWGGPRRLVVVSSDLRHYHDYATARRSTPRRRARSRAVRRSGSMPSRPADSSRSRAAALCTSAAAVSRSARSTCATPATPPTRATRWWATPRSSWADLVGTAFGLCPPYGPQLA